MTRRTLLVCLAAFLLIGVCVLGRLLPHPPNFTPVAAAALFAGFLFKRWSVALAVPLAAMLLSDLVLGFHQPGVMLFVYAGLAAPVLGRLVLRRRLTAPRVATCAMGGSLVFFGLSNLGVWLFSGLYGATWEGLVACYVAALPFLKYTVAGDLMWCAGFFGVYAVSRAVMKQSTPSAELAAA